MNSKKYDIPIKWRLRSLSEATIEWILISILFVFGGFIWTIWLYFNQGSWTYGLISIGLSILFGVFFFLRGFCLNPRKGNISYETGFYNVRILNMDFFIPPSECRNKLYKNVEKPFEEYTKEPIKDLIKKPITIIASDSSRSENIVFSFDGSKGHIIVCDSKYMLEKKMYDLASVAIANQIWPYKVTDNGDFQENIKWLKKRNLISDDMEDVCLKG